MNAESTPSLVRGGREEKLSDRSLAAMRGNCPGWMSRSRAEAYRFREDAQQLLAAQRAAISELLPRRDRAMSTTRLGR